MRPELALFLAASWLAAAETPRPQAEASVQFISLAGDREDLALWDGRRAAPLRLSADFFGPRLRYAGDTRLSLIQLPPSGTRPDTTAKAAPAANPPPVAPGPVIAWLDLPPSDTNGGPLKLILLVQPEAGRNGIVAMKDSDRDFPAGSLRFLNLCDFPLSLESGGSATAVAAKGTEDRPRRLFRRGHLLVRGSGPTPRLPPALLPRGGPANLAVHPAGREGHRAGPSAARRGAAPVGHERLGV